jgi:DNA-binding MarR family transcriptional regulator
MDKAINDKDREEILKKKDLTPKDCDVIHFLVVNSMITFEELQKGTGVDRIKLKAILEKLVSQGYVGTLITEKQYLL